MLGEHKTSANSNRSAAGPERGFVQVGAELGHRLLGIWFVTTSILFCLSVAWSFATPIGAAQDEPSQLVKASSVARGEIVGAVPSARSAAHLPINERVMLALCAETGEVQRCIAPYSVVQVPASFAHFASPSCYRLFPTVPAGCARTSPAPERKHLH